MDTELVQEWPNIFLLHDVEHLVDFSLIHFRLLVVDEKVFANLSNLLILEIRQTVVDMVIWDIAQLLRSHILRYLVPKQSLVESCLYLGEDEVDFFGCLQSVDSLDQ